MPKSKGIIISTRIDRDTSHKIREYVLSVNLGRNIKELQRKLQDQYMYKDSDFLREAIDFYLDTIKNGNKNFLKHYFKILDREMTLPRTRKVQDQLMDSFTKNFFATMQPMIEKEWNDQRKPKRIKDKKKK